MLDSLTSFLADNSKMLFWLALIVVATALVAFYLKKYLNRENQQMEEIRLDIERLKERSNQVSNRMKEMDSKAKYGQIGQQNAPLPFTIECIENTPFYNIIGSQLFAATEELTPTNKVDEATISDTRANLIEEMSEPSTDTNDAGNTEDSASLYSKDLVLGNDTYVEDKKENVSGRVSIRSNVSDHPPEVRTKNKLRLNKKIPCSIGDE